MTADETTESRIARIFRERMALEVASSEMDLVEAHLLDSLALVTMLQHLEEEFSVRFGAEDLEIEQLRTIALIAKLVDRKLRGANSTRDGKGKDGLGSPLP